MARNSSSGGAPSEQAGKTQLGQEDLEAIVQALASSGWGQSTPGGFQYQGFLLGLLMAVLVGYFFYNRIHRRSVSRGQERDAVDALKHMNDEQIKRVLGEGNLPSWLNFPDFERVDWVNTTLAQLWPYIDSAVSLRLSQIVAEALKKNKPAWIASLKLYRFRLGEAPPQVNGVKVYANRGGITDAVTMEFDFSWVGNQDVQLTIKPIPKHTGPFTAVSQVMSKFVKLRAGIERMIVNGRVRLIWKPLLDELPIIGGLQVALVEMPRFSFDVTVYGGDASMVPGLEEWLTAFLKDNVFRPYILPERYNLSFLDTGELEEMKPKGLLFVRVIEAVDVPRMDIFSGADPYVKLSVRHGMEFRTQIKENTAHPVWDEDFKFLVHEPEHQELHCILMDYDIFNPDDEIGRASIKIRDLPDGEAKDMWLKVGLQQKANTNTEQDKESQVRNKGRGVVGTVVGAEQAVAHAGGNIWKKLPGIKSNKDCRLHLEVAYYALDDQDLEAAAGESSTPSAQQSQNQREGFPRHNHQGGEDDAAAGSTAHGDYANSNTSEEADTVQHGGNAGKEEQAEIRQQQRQNFRDADRPEEAEQVPQRTEFAGEGSKHEDNDEGNVHAHRRGNVSLDPEERSENCRQQRQNLEDAHRPHEAEAARQQDGDEDQRWDESGDEAQTSGQGHHKSGHQNSKGDQDGKGHLANVDLRAMALDALRGGILVVRPKHAHDLEQKHRFPRLGLKPKCVVEVYVGKQSKTTAPAEGDSPVFDNTLEFLLGGEEVKHANDERVRLEVWDKKLSKLHLGKSKGQFRGGCNLSLAEVIRERHIRRTLRLQGVKKGELSVELHYFTAMEKAKQRKANFRPNT